MSLELLLSLGVGVLVACGVYLALRPRSFDVILGLTLLSYAVNLFIFASGRLAVNRAPIIGQGEATLAQYADPLPQALVLTAIVIGFGMTALLVAVAVAARRTTGDDRVDAGREPLP
ncbi:MAG: Na+/H+ antiporter subunit C [Immundisolibacter sp.]